MSEGEASFLSLVFLLLLLVIEFVCFVSPILAGNRERTSVILSKSFGPGMFIFFFCRKTSQEPLLLQFLFLPLFNSLMSLAKLTVGGQTTFTGSPTQDSSHKVLKEPKAKKKKTGGQKKEPKRELRILVARSYSAVEFLWLWVLFFFLFFFGHFTRAATRRREIAGRDMSLLSSLVFAGLGWWAEKARARVCRLRSSTP